MTTRTGHANYEAFIGKLAVRNYLTKLVWYQDRLCSLSSAWLVTIALGSVVGLAALAIGADQFMDDLTFLLGEHDARTASILFGFLLLGSIGLWVLSCCLGALGRRIMLYFKGL